MTRKYALFGSGNTGSKIPELLNADEKYTFFNSSNPLSVESLTDHDAIICFVPGPILLDHLQIILDSKIPLISGATGIDWPTELNQQLVEEKLTWVWADNFALGMNIIRNLIATLSARSSIYQEPDFHIHEAHHENKIDAPSGTAIRWQDWLQQESTISSDRQGDIVGEHHLTLSTEYEKITISHEALDRRIFAHGALWACRQVLNNDVPFGLLPLELLTLSLIHI